MTRTVHSGLALALLVPDPIRRAMRWRTVHTGEDLGLGKELCCVQVGPSSPYRLLVLEMSPDDLVSFSVYQVNGKMKMVKSGKVMSDLLPFAMEKLVEEFGLNA